jgi:hypothetical protein
VRKRRAVYAVLASVCAASALLADVGVPAYADTGDCAIPVGRLPAWALFGSCSDQNTPSVGPFGTIAVAVSYDTVGSPRGNSRTFMVAWEPNTADWSGTYLNRLNEFYVWVYFTPTCKAEIGFPTLDSNGGVMPANQFINGHANAPFFGVMANDQASAYYVSPSSCSGATAAPIGVEVDVNDSVSSTTWHSGYGTSGSQSLAVKMGAADVPNCKEPPAYTSGNPSICDPQVPRPSWQFTTSPSGVVYGGNDATWNLEYTGNPVPCTGTLRLRAYAGNGDELNAGDGSRIVVCPDHGDSWDVPYTLHVPTGRILTDLYAETWNTVTGPGVTVAHWSATAPSTPAPTDDAPPGSDVNGPIDAATGCHWYNPSCWLPRLLTDLFVPHHLGEQLGQLSNAFKTHVPGSWIYGFGTLLVQVPAGFVDGACSGPLPDFTPTSVGVSSGTGQLPCASPAGPTYQLLYGLISAGMIVTFCLRWWSMAGGMFGARED